MKFSTRKKSSIVSRRSVYNIRTPHLTVSRLRIFLAKITYYTLFLLLFFGIFFFFFFSEWLGIQKISVRGNVTIDEKTILSSIEPFFHKKVFFFFPSDNFFWVPVGQMEREIKNNFKRIDSLKINRVFPNSLEIDVKEKKAVILFCSGRGCIWVDEEGVAYNQSSYAEVLADNLGGIIVRDDSGTEIPLGQLATTPECVDFINKLAVAFPEKTKKEIDFLSVPLPSTEEIRVHTKEGWVAYFDISLDLDKSLELLNQVIEKKLKETQKDSTCLESVDLRIVDRIFFKLKDNCSN